MTADKWFIDDGDLPDPGKDIQLIPCPKCNANPNVIARSKGPTVLYFCYHLYQVVCLVCYHRSRPGKTDDEAIKNWNKDHTTGLLYFRKQLGLTRAEVADLTGFQENTIRRIEDRKSRGSKPTRRKIAAVLNVRVEDL